MVKRMKGKLKPSNTPILNEGIYYYTKEEKDRLLNEYYQTTMSNTAAINYPEEQLEKIRTEKEGGSQEYNTRFTMQEMENAKKNLKTNKAYGTDEINNSFLKNLPQTKTQELLVLGIYNRSWNSGKVPTTWKTGLIIPIAKPGKNPKLTESYRPITLLQCTSKLMENLVANRLNYIVESKNLLNREHA